MRDLFKIRRRSRKGTKTRPFQEMRTEAAVKGGIVNQAREILDPSSSGVTRMYAHAHLSTYLGLLLFTREFTREKTLRTCRDLSYLRWNLNSNRHTDAYVVCMCVCTCVSQDRSAASSLVGGRPRWADCRSAIGNIFQRREFIGRLPGNIWKFLRRRGR